MMKFEIKKIFVKTVNKIALFVLAVVVAAAALLAIRDVKYYTWEGQEVKSSFGPSAARKLKAERNQWAGTLMAETLAKAAVEKDAINSAAKLEDEAFVKSQGIADILELFNLAYAGYGEYDYYRKDSVTQEEASAIYEVRIASLNEHLTSGDGKGMSQNKKDYLVERYEELKTPFHYEYAEGWKALLESQYLPTLMTIVVVIIGFLVSGIFSDEFLYKADSIFFSTRLGRNKAVSAKIGAGLVTVTAVYWGAMLLFSGIILGVLGFGGSGCMIQTGMENWLSIYNITYLGEWFLTMCGGYVGNLFILGLAMFLSAKSRSTVFAVTVPFALSCVPMFLGRVPVLTQVVNVFPDMLLRIGKNLNDYMIYEIGGKVISLFGILIPVYLVLGAILIPLLYQTYRRAEIK